MQPVPADDEDPVVYELAPHCTIDDIDPDAVYIATINGIVDYGIFVDLSEHVSGLVHETTFTGDSAVSDLRVGDRIVVGLETIRENGDIAFYPIDADPTDPVTVDASYDVATVADLSTDDGEVHLEGEVVQIKQTSGPTVFYLRDGSGVIACTAYDGAGVRAHADIAVGDLVHAVGRVERHEGDRQVELSSIETVPAEHADELLAALDAATSDRARAHEIEPLVEWPALEPLLDDLAEVATLIRRTILEGRPIRMRHHADGDGMCAAVPLSLAIERFIDRVYTGEDASRYLVKRLPSKAPFYEMEDATRDLNYSLTDRARHGQQLPLLLMLDNGSTKEDVPAYETLAHYDIPIIAIDHHHPDPSAVEPLLDAHVNPYLYGEDYRITTGMLCVELARMIDPSVTEAVYHLPAVAGLADRSRAETMNDYLELAADHGYDEDDLIAISEAVDYLAHWLRYRPGTPILRDVLDIDCDEPNRHRDLVDFLAQRANADIDRQLSAAEAHIERQELDNGAILCQIDVEEHVHRFTYPAPGTTTGRIHDHVVAETGGPVITIGYGPDFAVLRSDGVRLDIPQMVTELSAEITGGGVTGGGHLVVGSIKFVKGMRDPVIEALVDKMAAAELDAELSSAAIGLED